MSERKAMLTGLTVAVLCGLMLATFLSSIPAIAAETGTFIIRCDSSHRNNDDPIVFPGQPGASHEHQFFGARTTNAFSTLESMRASTTTCRHPGDTAGYWAPSYRNAQGQTVTPIFSFAYYKIEPVDEPFPPDFKMIAGPARAFWDCFNGGGNFPAPPRCNTGDFVVERLSFPDCWDGRLDSTDHRSHVAYKVGGKCPASHSRNLPRINFFNRVCREVSGAACMQGGRHSDGSALMHADFWNTWNQTALVDLINRCRSRNCGQVTA